MPKSKIKSPILFLGIFLIIFSCNQKQTTDESFSMSSVVTDVKTGEALLSTYNKETKKVDTLAYSEIIDGAFTFDSTRIEFTEPTKFMLTLKPSKEESEGRGFSKKTVIVENKPLKCKFGVWENISEIPDCKYHDLIVNIDNNYPKLKQYKDSMDHIRKVYREDFTEQEKKDKLAEIQESIRKLNTSHKELLSEIVFEQYKETDDNIYKGLLLNIYGRLFDLEEYVEEANAVLPQLDKNSLTYKSILDKKNETLTKLAVGVGKKSIGFSLSDLDNNPIALNDILNKNEYVLLDFWASWCAPCRKDIPILKELYSEFHQKGFEIFMVSIDTKEDKWVKASEEEEFKWYNTLDSKKVKDLYGVTFIPQNFLIDKNHEIVGVNLRDKELENKLAELLNE